MRTLSWAAGLETYFLVLDEPFWRPRGYVGTEVTQVVGQRSYFHHKKQTISNIKLWSLSQLCHCSDLVSTYLVGMGRIFIDHPGGTRVYSCTNCDTALTNRSELVSTVSFIVYLFQLNIFSCFYRDSLALQDGHFYSTECKLQSRLLCALSLTPQRRPHNSFPFLQS